MSLREACARASWSLLWLALGSACLSAQAWEGDQTAQPVPPTAMARQSDVSLGLLAKTRSNA